jgi:hypothetical protein
VTDRKPLDRETLLGMVAEGTHTAFRKATGCSQAWQIWKLIDEMPGDEWEKVVKFIGEPIVNALEEDGWARSWKVEGKDGFDSDADYYPVSDGHVSYDAALLAARARLIELDRTQSDAGGQSGIQDRVYIVYPDGKRLRVFR